MLRLSFVRRDGAWMLTEILQVDADLHLVSETLKPTIRRILDRRNNKTAARQSTSDFVRILFAMDKDAKTAIPIADRALRDDPKNPGLRYLKALALAEDEKLEDAVRLWEELAGETPPFAPALRSLAAHYDSGEEAESQKAIAFYERYRELVPEDPRTHVLLAMLYEARKDDVRAEGEYRKGLKADPGNTDQFVDFAAFLVMRKRFQEAESVITEIDKQASAGDDFFGDLMVQLYFAGNEVISEEFARSQPARMGKSARANVYLAYLRLENGKSLQAIALLKKAAALKTGWAEPYTAMARSYRNMKNWAAALTAADTAIKLEPNESEGHFQRACALARLGRTSEALKSLEKAVELDPELPDTLDLESDLKVLASQPAFKKLMAPRAEEK
jgi:tetratricopeptide (TPR) repeat protein